MEGWNLKRTGGWLLVGGDKGGMRMGDGREKGERGEGRGTCRCGLLSSSRYWGWLILLGV